MNKKIRAIITSLLLFLVMGTITSIKTVNVQAYTYKVATVTVPRANLYTGQGKLIIDRSLVANTDWRIGEIKVVNNTHLLQVSTDEWLRLQDCNPNFNVDTGHILRDFIGTIKDNNTQVFNDETKQYNNQSQRFPKNSIWKVNYIIKNSQGQYFYRVSNHEFITKTDMWLNDIPQDADIVYNADFGLNNQNKDGQVTEPPKTNVPNNSIQSTPQFNEDTNTIANAIVQSVNAERQSHGVSPLKQHSGLMQAAAIRAQEQVKSYGHIRPDGQSWDTILTKQYYPETALDSAENALSVSAKVTDPYKIASLTMAGFKGSVGHYKAIMDPKFKDIGVGVYLDKSGENYFVVQIFANPYVDWRHQNN